MADSPQKVDPEDFQAWKDSPMTQWVISCLREQADREMADQKKFLFHSPRQMAADQWASLQASAAFVQGQVDRTDYIVGITLAQLQTEDDE